MKALKLAEQLHACADDPMWDAHAEILKSTARLSARCIESQDEELTKLHGQRGVLAGLLSAALPELHRIGEPRTMESAELTDLCDKVFQALSAVSVEQAKGGGA